MKTRLWSLALAATLASGAAEAQTPPVADEAPRAATSFDPSARVVGYVAAGLGVAGIGVGTVFGVSAISRKVQADKDCNAANICSRNGLVLQQTGQRDGDIATASLIGGAVLFGTGLALILAPPRALAPDRGETGPRAHLEITPSSARLVGSF